MRFRPLLQLMLLVVPSLAAAAERVEVIYERKMTAEERSWYNFVGSRSALDSSKPLDQVRQELKSQNWGGSRKMVKVELVIRDEKPVAIQMEEIVNDARREKAELEWKKDAPSRLMLGKDVGEFKRGYSSVRWIGLSVIYYEGTDYVGRAEEEFAGPNGQKVGAQVYEVPDHDLDEHEFLRRIIMYGYAPEDSDIGTVLVTKGKRWGGRIGVAWTSGKRMAVFLSGDGVTVGDLVKMFGTKFPNSLRRDIKVDREAWCRQEMDARLDSARRALEGKLLDKNDDEPFATHIHLLKGCIYVPMLETDQAVPRKPEDQRALLDELTAWWAKHKEGSYFYEDQRVCKLVGKGQSPSDLRAAATRLAYDEKMAILAKPMSEEETAAAKGAAIRAFEAPVRERVKQGLVSDNRYSFEKVKEGEWRLTTPGGNNTAVDTITYRGPRFVETAEPERPLKATFSGRMDGSPDGPAFFEEYWFYRKLTKDWVKAGSAATKPAADAAKN